ncbi:MAG: polynucleotide adenylyltransferase PcnB, partial [Gammaproteobacteria bacterium]
LFDEFLKLFFHGHARSTYFLLEKYDLLKYLLPMDVLKLSPHMQAFVEQALIKTDERVDHDQSVNPAFLLAVFLWPKFVEATEILKTTRMNPALAAQRAISKVLSSNELPMAIPKRFTEIIRDIWLLQWRFTQLVRHQGVFVSLHKRFRAGYDFLVLRAVSDPKLIDAAAWWTHFQAAEHAEQQLLLEQLPLAPKKKKRRKTQRKKSVGTKNSVHSAGE